MSRPPTNRIDATFAALRRTGKKALIGYLTAGFPDKTRFRSLVTQVEAAGVDILEMGVPFSDPVADGPTIQRASQKALEHGVTLAWILETVHALRIHRNVRMPIVLMSYCNPVLAMGTDRFFSKARQAGVDGLIIPDLIPEEGKAFRSAARREGIRLIYLVSPTTPTRRIRSVARLTEGFLYAVSVAGVTGARKSLARGLSAFLGRVRPHCRTPLAVGFGLSTPAHLRSVRPYVDGVIVGSALLRAVESDRSSDGRSVRRYVASLQNALNPVHVRGGP